MYAPIFETVVADPAVTALLGSPITRLWPFGEAPEDLAKPYAVWQQIAGTPGNYINQTPDIDSYMLQVDVYADTATSVRAVAKALRNAIEPNAHITAWRGESKDVPTGLYRYSFDLVWWTPR